MQDATAPLAVYSASSHVDVSAGIRILETAGLRVARTDAFDPDGVAAVARDAVALLVGYGRVTARLLDGLPRLQVVSLFSQGHDNVDLAACSAAGVRVAHIPPLATEEVATHAWTMTLALLRQLPFYARTVDWTWTQRPATEPRRLSAVTVGVVGTGNTAARYVGHALPHVAAVTSHSRSGRTLPGVRPAGLPELLAASDVVSLHVPLSDETRGLVDGDFLAAMRPGSYLVNIARGGLLDPHAVARALDRGHLAGVAVDVLDQEPPPADHPLMGRDDVIVTPHVAWLSRESVASYAAHQARNVIDALQQAPLQAGRPGCASARRPQTPATKETP